MGCFHPEILLFSEGLFPNLGDKKPESRLSLYNSASQTFVSYAASFTYAASAVNDLFFIVSAVKNVIKLSQRYIPARVFFNFL